MKKVVIPVDRDEIVSLTKSVIASNPKAVKETGVKPPAPVLKALKSAGRKADKGLTLIHKHERAIKELSGPVNSDIAVATKALRDFAQIVKRQASTESDLEKWGFTLRESSVKSGDEPKQ